MSGSTVFNARIKGVDGATGPFQRIAASMKGLIESTKGLAQATKGLTKESAAAASAHHRMIASVGAHVRLLHGHLGSVTAGISSLRSGLAGLVPAIGALGAGASLAGLFELTKGVAESAGEMEATTIKTGLSAKEFGGFAYAAKLAHVPVETLSGGIEKLHNLLGTVGMGGGGNKLQKALLQHLHINPRDVKSQEDLIYRLVDVFKGTKTIEAQTALARKLFGKSGVELLPLLTQGSDALRKQAAEGARLVYKKSPEEKEALKEYEKQWIGLEGAIKGFKNEVGSKLAAPLGDIVKWMKEWVIENRHWIATDLAAAVKLLGDWLKELDIKQIVTDMTVWFKSMRDGLNSIGGLRTALVALGLVMTGEMLGALSSAAKGFRGMAAAAWAMNAALWANPILLALAAVAAAALLVWYYWDELRALWAKTPTWVKDLVTAFAPFIGLPMTIADNWDTLKPFFTKLWDDLRGGFQRLIDDPSLKHFAETMPRLVIEGWDRVKTYFTSFGTWIKSIFADIKDALAWFFNPSPSWYQNLPRVPVPAPAAPLPGPRIEPAPGPSRSWFPPHRGLPVPRPPALPPQGWNNPWPNMPTPERLAWKSSQWPGMPTPERLGWNRNPWPSLYRDDGPVRLAMADGAAGAPGASGTVRVTIEGRNIQPGTRIRAEASGSARVEETNVGYTSPMPRYA